MSHIHHVLFVTPTVILLLRVFLLAFLLQPSLPEVFLWYFLLEILNVVAHLPQITPPRSPLPEFLCHFEGCYADILFPLNIC